MKAEIEKHIDSMREDFLEYANYKVSEHNSTMSGSELLDYVIESFLAMPEEQINEMFNIMAREKYNRLDFRILKRIRFLSKLLGQKETASIEES